MVKILKNFNYMYINYVISSLIINYVRIYSRTLISAQIAIDPLVPLNTLVILFGPCV